MTDEWDEPTAPDVVPAPPLPAPLPGSSARLAFGRQWHDVVEFVEHVGNGTTRSDHRGLRVRGDFREPVEVFVLSRANEPMARVEVAVRLPELAGRPPCLEVVGAPDEATLVVCVPGWRGVPRLALRGDGAGQVPVEVTARLIADVLPDLITFEAVPSVRSVEIGLDGALRVAPLLFRDRFPDRLDLVTPELLQGATPSCDARWVAGVLAFELASGQAAFRHSNFAGRARLIAAANLERAAMNTIEPALADVIRGCVCATPTDRMPIPSLQNRLEQLAGSRDEARAFVRGALRGRGVTLLEEARADLEEALLLSFEPTAVVEVRPFERHLASTDVDVLRQQIVQFLLTET